MQPHWISEFGWTLCLRLTLSWPMMHSTEYLRGSSDAATTRILLLAQIKLARTSVLSQETPVTRQHRWSPPQPPTVSQTDKFSSIRLQVVSFSAGTFSLSFLYLFYYALANFE
eukprot:m.70796 g.70796  ORF g.70796 m.70796 type:complete len:113 (-) comp50153_c0_seq3:40-378(-)